MKDVLDVLFAVMCVAVIVAATCFVVSSVSGLLTVRRATRRFERAMDELDRQHDELEQASRLDE